jgi:hypothetical protein
MSFRSSSSWVDLLRRALRLGLDAVHARVPGERHDRDHHQHEERVRPGAVPERAPLERHLPLVDRLQIGRERVREVVRLDDEPPRLHDLPLDLGQLVRDLVREAARPPGRDERRRPARQTARRFGQAVPRRRFRRGEGGGASGFVLHSGTPILHFLVLPPKVRLIFGPSGEPAGQEHVQGRRAVW